MNENIGKFIAYLRKENNMTQQELAEKLGVSDRSVSNWENGKCLPDICRGRAFRSQDQCYRSLLSPKDNLQTKERYGQLP